MNLEHIKPSTLTDEERITYINWLLVELNNHTDPFSSVMNRIRKMSEDFDTLHRDVYHLLECVDSGEVKLSASERIKLFNKMVNNEGDRRKNKELLERGEALETLLREKPVPIYRTTVQNDISQLGNKHKGIRDKAKDRGILLKEKLL
ncbi:TPA: hypothetical protein ACOAY7_002831 [Vibrio cholerae]|nr:hypothetical protein 2017DRC106_0675 [Vibrio phage ICP1]QVV97763.1 hypothetical protein 2017DRC32_0675 [Vibrio phage ICP1]QVV97990.1 hypothetical protein 2017DRC48_0675 [Vibrio phage ICP1]QVV98217.1 hypothetical protein 2017DRC55_0675 [Vibrio phage ICP1]QVV98443.1 hypothetical protein 2017DRC72_0670 [Vibrio phage ICP1]